MAEIRFGHNPFALQARLIEGPSRAQAQRMTKTRREFLAQARAVEQVYPQGALELDFDAWDIENDLRTYGFDVETGKKLRP